MALHDSREDGWTVIYDKVYDVTEFLSLHPGGEDVILEYLGYDATLAFRGVGHSKAAVRMLKRLDSNPNITKREPLIFLRYLIGILPLKERLNFST